MSKTTDRLVLATPNSEFTKFWQVGMTVSVTSVNRQTGVITFDFPCPHGHFPCPHGQFVESNCTECRSLSPEWEAQK